MTNNNNKPPSSVTNVTGSNSVNVFLGLGIPWIMGSIYWSSGKTSEWTLNVFMMKKGKMLIEDNPDGGLIHYGEELGFSVMVYSLLAMCALGMLDWRRRKIGGEFGGPAKVGFFKKRNTRTGNLFGKPVVARATCSESPLSHGLTPCRTGNLFGKPVVDTLL